MDQQPIALTPEQIEQFRRDGYLQVENLLTEAEVDAFVEHESKPIPPDQRRGLLNHTVDEQWNYLATHPNIAGVARQLLEGPPRIVQTMYMAKAPTGPEEETGGAGVAWHQDTHYLPNEPNTLMACWIAMSDTDPDNGGLCVVQGSNQDGLRSAHFNEDSKEHASWEAEHEMKGPDGREWVQQFHSFEVDGITKDDLTQLTVAKGSGVFFTGFTIHGSYANRSQDRERLAFAVHYIKQGTWLYRCDVQDTVAVDTI